MGILGIGSPIMDKFLTVTDEFLKTTPAQKGDLILLDPFLQEQIVDRYHGTPLLLAGGCSANVLKTLSLLGYTTRLVGKIGVDSAAEYYTAYLRARGVEPALVSCDI